jgi:HAMP domain-containing protein
MRRNEPDSMANSKLPHQDYVTKAAAAAFQELLRSAKQISAGDMQHEMAFVGTAIALMLARVSAVLAAFTAERDSQQELSMLAEVAGRLLPELDDDLATVLKAASISRMGTGGNA